MPNPLASIQRMEHFRAWTDDIPEGWVEDFVEQGLRPFLKQYGYELSQHKHIYKRIIWWAWSHVFVYHTDNYTLSVQNPMQIHDGTQEDFSWFTHKISDDAWTSFYRRWYIDDWLDDTEIGYRQQLHFPEFIYCLLDLGASPSYHKLHDLLADISQQGVQGLQGLQGQQGTHGQAQQAQGQQEYDHENYAYGGDRRTY